MTALLFIFGIPLAVAAFALACGWAMDPLASGMSAGTAETRSGSGLQPASPTAESGDAQIPPSKDPR